MNKRNRQRSLLAVIGVVAVIVGFWVWERDKHPPARIASIAGLKQVGLSFRWERNDIARFTAQGERLEPPARNGAH